MWEIYLRNPDPEDDEGLALIVPNLRSDWKPPQVGDVWGPFRVVAVDEEGGWVDIEIPKEDLVPIP